MKRFRVFFLFYPFFSFFLFSCEISGQTSEFSRKTEESRKRAEQRRQQIEDQMQRSQDEAKRRFEQRRSGGPMSKKDLKRHREGTVFGDEKTSFEIAVNSTGSYITKLRTPAGINVLSEENQGRTRFSFVVNTAEFHDQLVDGEKPTSTERFLAQRKIVKQFVPEADQRLYNMPPGYDYVMLLTSWRDNHLGTSTNDSQILFSLEYFINLHTNIPRKYNALACFAALTPPADKGKAEISMTASDGLRLELKPGGTFFHNVVSKNKAWTKKISSNENLTQCRWMAYTVHIEKKPVTVALCSWPEQEMYAYTKTTEKDNPFEIPILAASWKDDAARTTNVPPGRVLRFCYGIFLWDTRAKPTEIEGAYSQWIRDEKKYLQEFRRNGGVPRPNVPTYCCPELGFVVPTSP